MGSLIVSVIFSIFIGATYAYITRENRYVSKEYKKRNIKSDNYIVYDGVIFEVFYLSENILALSISQYTSVKEAINPSAIHPYGFFKNNPDIQGYTLEELQEKYPEEFI